MQDLQDRLTYCRQLGDEGYLLDCFRQLKNFSSSKSLKTILEEKNAPLLIRFILEYIACSTHNLPGCDINAEQDKLSNSLSSFKKAEVMSIKDSKLRSKFLQSAELLTRTYIDIIGFTASAQLRSTIFNNFAMIHRLCDRPHAALKCLVAAVEVEVEARNSSVDQALTHLNLSAVLSSLNRHRDSLGHANIAVKLLSRCVKKKNGIPAEKNDNEEEDSATTSSKAAEKRVASLLTMAHYNAGVEREYLKHRASSLVSYRSALKMAQDQLPKDHPVIKSIASGIFDASTNSVESYKLPTPPTGSPRSMNGGPRADRIALNHLGLRGDTDANIINQPFSKSPRSKLIATNHKKKHKKIKRYGSLEEEIVAKFKSATKHGRTIHGHKIETIEDIFIAIDEDGGGSLDRDEFKKGLNRLSIFLSPNAVDKLMKEFLLDGHEEGNEITFNGFMAVMNRKFDKKHLNTSHSHHIASRKSFSSASLKKAEHKRKKEALRFSLLNNSENQQSKAEMEIKTIKNIPLEKYVDLNQFPDLVNNALHSLFQEFDTNSSGHITFKEVKAMLLILPERTNLQDSGMDNKFDDEDAGRIMLAFDADGNGEIEEEEFSNWIKTGLSRSKEEREHFSQTGTLAKKLSIFLDSMECLIQNIISPDITQFKVA